MKIVFLLLMFAVLWFAVGAIITRSFDREHCVDLGPYAVVP